MGRFKQKGSFEHVQNAKIHIILRMRKVSSRPLLSIQTFFCIMFILDNEGADQTARMRRLNWVYTVSIYPDMFSHDIADIVCTQLKTI